MANNDSGYETMFSYPLKFFFIFVTNDDPLNWCYSSVECIVQNTMCEVGENDIILMHDYYETSVTAALKIVDELLEDGFTFVTVEEILFE